MSMPPLKRQRRKRHQKDVALRVNKKDVKNHGAAKNALLQFCQYVEHEVHTQNLMLLRRMVDDFFDANGPNDQTIQDFIRTGIDLIAICPFRMEKDVMAPIQLKLQPTSSENQLFFDFLEFKVVTHNLSLLRWFFYEFCRGHNTMLRQFLQDGYKVISILPEPASARKDLNVRTATAHPAKPVTPVTSIRRQQQNVSPQKPKTSRRKPKTKAILSDAEEPQNDRSCIRALEEREVLLDDDDGLHTEPEQRSKQSRNLTDEYLATRRIVNDKLLEYAAQAPWRIAFENVTLPFPVAKAPKLASMLQTFWTKYDHAVWDRMFWAPLNQPTDTLEYSRRKRRQRFAVKAFREIIHEAYRVFGADIFLKLDMKRYEGWWYRRPLLKIFKLYTTEGRARCWALVEEEMTKRFPFDGWELPLDGRSSGSIGTEEYTSASMWLREPDTLHILHAMTKRQQEKQKRAFKILRSDQQSNDPDETHTSVIVSPHASPEY